MRHYGYESDAENAKKEFNSLIDNIVGSLILNEL